jgi:hypothetical protein
MVLAGQHRRASSQRTDARNGETVPSVRTAYRQGEGLVIRVYEYSGFSLEVDVEAESAWQQRMELSRQRGFVATVRIFRAGDAVAFFSPWRFGEAGGHPFRTDVDALMGGFSAACKIIDDLFGHPGRDYVAR